MTYIKKTFKQLKLSALKNNIKKNKFWCFIPAKLNSKTIKKKNLKKIGKFNLIERSISVANKSNSFEKIICSSESLNVKKYCLNKCEFHLRSLNLSKKFTLVEDVIKNYLDEDKSSSLPEFIFLIEPTSPFIEVSHIKKLINLMKKSKSHKTGQTISRPPHTHLAFNQRSFDGKYIKFISKKRYKTRLKQKKPLSYIFGNICSIRTSHLLNNGKFFDQPSIGFEIPFKYSINIDEQEDIKIAKVFNSL